MSDEATSEHGREREKANGIDKAFQRQGSNTDLCKECGMVREDREMQVRNVRGVERERERSESVVNASR